MKKKLVLVSAVVLLSLVSTACLAQENELPQKVAAPSWVSDKGYWVIEGNVRSPKQNTVYFYTLDNVLVYKEQVEGTKINVKRKKVCLRLKAALEQALAIWEVTHRATENEALVAVALKK